jgi:hypothetical protein
MVAHPFLSAVCSGQIETVATLLKDDRVDVNQRNKYNQTALLIASNHKALVAELLKHDKIDVNLQDNDGHTAFTKATSLIHYTDSVARIVETPKGGYESSRQMWCHSFHRAQHFLAKRRLLLNC